MNKSVLTVVIVVLVVLAGGGTYLALHKSNKNNNIPTTSSNNTSSNTAKATNSVSIANFAFSPSDITVKKGTSVTWTNNDSATHTVTETDGQKGPDSGDLATGKSYSFTFDTAGTFKYHCAMHPNMTGTVTVTE